MEKRIHLFDMDGTLTDSMGVWTKNVFSILNECGIEYTPELVRKVTPLGDAAAAEMFRSMGVKDDVDAILRKMRENAYKEYSENVMLKPGAKAYLDKLKNEGCRLFVLTASAHQMADACLKHNGIYDYFETVWTVEDFPSSKGKKETYQLAAQRIGEWAGKIWFYDDNYRSLWAAQRAGMRCIGVYDETSKDDAFRISAVTERYVRSFEELL